MLKVVLNDFTAPSSSCLPPHFPERALVLRAWGKTYCTIWHAVTSPAGSIPLLWECSVPFWMHPAFNSPFLNLSSGSKTLCHEVLVPAVGTLERESSMAYFISSTELSKDYPFKLFNSLLLTFIWSFSLGKNCSFGYSVFSMLTHQIPVNVLVVLTSAKIPDRQFQSRTLNT